MAHLTRTRPCSVDATPRGPRSNRRTPSLCSTSAIVFDMAGCDVPTILAAFTMLADLATARRKRSSRVLKRRAAMSSQSISIPYSLVIEISQKTITPIYRFWLVMGERGAQPYRWKEMIMFVAQLAKRIAAGVMLLVISSIETMAQTHSTLDMYVID